MSHAEWKSAEPFLTDSQMRILVAIKNGYHTMPEFAKATHRHPNHIRGYIIPRLKQWGLVYYAHGAHQWHLTHNWDETLEAIKQRIRWHMEQLCLSIDDFQNPPALDWLEEDSDGA